MLSFMLCYVDFYSKEAQTSCQKIITKENPHFVMALILTEPNKLWENYINKTRFLFF